MLKAIFSLNSSGRLEVVALFVLLLSNAFEPSVNIVVSVGVFVEALLRLLQ